MIESKAQKPSGQASPSHSPIVELRQYTLHPQQRDVLIELFEREFIETQEAVGMIVIGQFRDLDDPHRFVFVRSFPDMARRREALQAFYGGPVWKAHREAANATMVDSSNVLLLHPAHPASGFAFAASNRPPPGATTLPPGVVVATIWSFDAPVDDDVPDVFERVLAPLLREYGASILAVCVTEESVNDFPALPVREGEHVFVWVSLFEDSAAYTAQSAALGLSLAWRDAMAKTIAPRLKGPPEVVRLAPTARSQLHG